MEFVELALRIERLYDAGIPPMVIATTMVAEGIAPPLGAARWSVNLVDRVLILAGNLKAHGHRANS